MARLYESSDEYRHGTLIIEEQSSSDCTEIFYVPSRQQLELFGLDAEDASKYRVKLLELNNQKGWLTIFPINTLRRDEEFLGPKYRQVRKITLADGKPVLSPSIGGSGTPEKYIQSITFGPTTPIKDDVEEDDIAEIPVSVNEILEILENLPPTFTKDYDYGLGFAKAYRFIVNAVEGLTNCTEIFISGQRQTEADQDKKVFYISTSDFETVRKLLNSATNMSQTATRSVKQAETYNFFAQKLGQPEIPIKIGRSPLRKLITTVVQEGGKILLDEEQEEVIEVIENNIKSISQNKPEKLARLQHEIDLVNLEVLIDKFEAMLTTESDEEVWQEFLNGNPFILSLAFGYPIIKVQEKASIGGRKISGSGEKITDFLVKNSMTSNTALVEIKTPKAKLLNKEEFRGGVFVPSAILSGSINQVLDQKYQFEREISRIKDNSGIFDIKSYSVHCCLVIGTMPSEDNQQKSFELFRGNSKDIEIITFDELLEKLKNLKDFLEPTKKTAVSLAESDLPF